MRQRFGLNQVIMIGDRGMISSKAISEMRNDDGIAWITALKSVSIHTLVEQGQLQMGCSMNAICWRSVHRTTPASA
ncbi:hypothetical protein [Verminephrobacter aporrectodeae]|uniref:hypothetical protein n=1 Tax=Verminephrobacter aporrectodeae TaxID=1110389 RepID=UPI002237160C|nr:hypothetical protein [Verminephrobacter aporrectodeae]